MLFCLLVFADTLTSIHPYEHGGSSITLFSEVTKCHANVFVATIEEYRSAWLSHWQMLRPPHGIRKWIYGFTDFSRWPWLFVCGILALKSLYHSHQ